MNLWVSFNYLLAPSSMRFFLVGLQWKLRLASPRSIVPKKRTHNQSCASPVGEVFLSAGIDFITEESVVVDMVGEISGSGRWD